MAEGVNKSIIIHSVEEALHRDYHFLECLKELGPHYLQFLVGHQKLTLNVLLPVRKGMSLFTKKMA